MFKKLGNGTDEYYDLKERATTDIYNLPMDERDEARKQLSKEIDARYGDDEDAQYIKKTYLK